MTEAGRRRHRRRRDRDRVASEAKRRAVADIVIVTDDNPRRKIRGDPYAISGAPARLKSAIAAPRSRRVVAQGGDALRRRGTRDQTFARRS
jgi:hypothetical protein